MSTFLEIAKDYAREARFAQLNAAISTVVGQSGRNLEAVEAIKNAYIDIQNRHQWGWMEHRFTLPTVDTVDTYAFGAATDSTSAAAIDRFSRWKASDWNKPFTIYLTSAGVGTQHDLLFLEWDEFQYIYKRGSQVDSYPAHVTIDPQDNIVVGPAPNGVYTISGTYARGPQILMLDADVPDMPVSFHSLIWAYALEIYGMNHAANNILTKAGRLSKRRMMQLESNQLPPMPMAGPMA